MKYFYKVDEIYPYVWDNNCKVELWSGWNININEDSRIDGVTTIASLSYGNQQAKNPEKLYKKLQELKHESLWEFINLPYNENRKKESARNTRIPTFEDYKDKDLIEQLIRDHKSDIATFKITVPVFVARQFMRHCCFSYLEMSRRYVKDQKIPFTFYEIPDLNEEMIEKVREYYSKSIELYRELIKQGIRPERARSVIPVGMYTTFYTQGDFECLKNFFNLRLKKDAQEDIRLVAKGMLNLLEKHQTLLYDRLIGKEI